jgi:hypothetical protein
MAKPATSSPAQAKEESVQTQPKQETKQTSFLASIKLVPMEKGATSKGDPVLKARENVIKEVRKQQEAVKLELNGEALPTKSFKVDGKDRTRKFAKWYFQKRGVVFTQVRYGQRSVFMDGDKPQAIEVGKELKDLLVFYDGLVASIEKGELDERLSPYTERKKDK